MLVMKIISRKKSKKSSEVSEVSKSVPSREK